MKVCEDKNTNKKEMWTPESLVIKEEETKEEQDHQTGKKRKCRQERMSELLWESEMTEDNKKAENKG